MSVSILISTPFYTTLFSSICSIPFRFVPFPTLDVIINDMNWNSTEGVSRRVIRFSDLQYQVADWRMTVAAHNIQKALLSWLGWLSIIGWWKLFAEA